MGLESTLEQILNLLWNILKILGLIFCFRPGLIFSFRPGLIFFQPGPIFFSDSCGDSLWDKGSSMWEKSAGESGKSGASYIWVSSLVLSRWPKICKNVKKQNKNSQIPSLLSAHAGIYVSTQHMSCFSTQHMSCVSTQHMPCVSACHKSIKNVMNGIPVAPHRLTFGQNEVHRLQEAF